MVAYSGPQRLTPRYPIMQQLAVAGDFEAVLSFGLGLSSVAGISTSAPPGTGSLILDLWRTAPPNLIWPSASLGSVRDFQHLAENGNHTWMLNARDVASLYTQNVLGWPRGDVRAVGEHVYQVDGNPGFSVTVTLAQPLGRSHTVWTVASVVDSAGSAPYIPQSKRRHAVLATIFRRQTGAARA